MHVEKQRQCFRREREEQADYGQQGHRRGDPCRPHHQMRERDHVDDGKNISGSDERCHVVHVDGQGRASVQKPDATLLAGYSGWQKKFERHVKPGEHGIKIFAPAPVKVQIEREKKDPDTDLPELDENGDPVMETVEIKTPKFKVVTVFDVSQTDGKPLPDLGIDELAGHVENFDQF